MLNSGKKNCTSRDKNILTSVLSEKKNSERKKQNTITPPPCRLNGRSRTSIRESS